MHESIGTRQLSRQKIQAFRDSGRGERVDGKEADGDKGCGFQGSDPLQECGEKNDGWLQIPLGWRRHVNALLRMTGASAMLTCAHSARESRLRARER